MSPRTSCLVVLCFLGVHAGVVPGQAPVPWEHTYDMARSTGIMICNSSGHVGARWGARWGLVDIDWNSNKNAGWATAAPMNCEEDMLQNANEIKAINSSVITWVYRNGIKALPWLTSVRKRLQDPAYWGWFMPLKGCNPSPGVYTCGPNATNNLYHDFEQTPRGDCGEGVECGEYVFNHRNASLLTDFLLKEYFFGPTAAGNANVSGFYVDDGWSSAGPSEMDADAVEKMGMSTADVSAMEAAWKANQQAWRDALYDAGSYEWFLFYGGQQTAPGWDQSKPETTCASFMKTNCGADSPSQNGTLFFGYSRVSHHQPWPLPHATEDLAAFLLVRGPSAYFGYGWAGCVDADKPFTRPAALDMDYGTPVGFCSETAPGSGVYEREWTKAKIKLDCNSFKGSIDMKE